MVRVIMKDGSVRVYNSARAHKFHNDDAWLELGLKIPVAENSVATIRLANVDLVEFGSGPCRVIPAKKRKRAKA